LTNRGWYDDLNVIKDTEFKITEFDYENYFDSKLLNREVTSSEDFKNLVRALNIFSHTRYEKL